MDLRRALGLPFRPRLAFVGAGGKTTAMFQLARQLPPPVLVTASTHLAVEQLKLADTHFFIDSPADLPALVDGLFSGVILLTGRPTDPDRTAGLPAETLERVCSLADQHQFPVLIEADGSRRLPLKAPAEHEPEIPPFVDTVVVVAGLSALNKPLDSTWVHRPEIFSTLVEKPVQALISPEIITRVLLHQQGGLKNIPAGARRIALLNQADTPQQQAAASEIAHCLLPAFQRVVIAALNPQSPVNNQQSIIHAVHQSIAGVILAAGESRRFGQPKLLLEWQNQPIIRHVAQTALAAGLSPVIVVTGEFSTEIQAALTGLDLSVIHNADWQAGQSSSLQTGLQAIAKQRDAVVFLLGDQPQIPASLIHKLVEAHAQNGEAIVAPLVDGQRGNPVLFDHTTFSDLMALDGDVGGRKLFAKFPVNWVLWHDAAPLLDVDTPEDYERLLERDP